MKNIALALLLIISGFTFAQRDTLNFANKTEFEAYLAKIGLNETQIQLIQTSVDNIINGNIDNSGITIRLDSVDARIARLTERVSRLEVSQPPILTPTPPTDFEVHGVTPSSLAGTYTETTSPVDSHYIEMRDYSAFGDQNPYVIVAKTDSGVTNFTISSGILSNSVYELRVYSVKYINGIPTPSAYSTSDTALIPQNAPPTTTPGIDYYVSADAIGGGTGAFNDELTIHEAFAIAQAGDTVLIKKGNYILDDTYAGLNTGNLTASNSGTITEPIVFIGEIDGFSLTDKNDMDWKYVGGDSMTVLRLTCDNTSTAYDFSLTVSGDYIEFHKIKFDQILPLKSTVSITTTSSHATFDSCIFTYPSNSASGAVHTFMVYGTNATLKHCWFDKGSRCIIWVRDNNTNNCENFLMEHCVISGATNHYPIQLMPSTDATAPLGVQNATIRYNYFVDNPYESAIYLRNVQGVKIHNNLIVKSGGRYGTPINIQSHPVNADTVNSNTWIAYNTYIADGYNTYSQEFVHAFGNLNNVHLKNNIAIFNNLSSNLYRGGCLYNTNPGGQRWTSDYNLFYDLSDPTWATANSTWQQPGGCTTSTYTYAQIKTTFGWDVHSITGQLPDFINAGIRNYRLNTGSAGKNDGNPTGISEMDNYDFDGTPRNAINPSIGCFE